MRPNFKFYDLQPRDGSHYLLENGEPIARFNELSKAEAVRARAMSLTWPQCTNATPTSSRPRSQSKGEGTLRLK